MASAEWWLQQFLTKYGFDDGNAVPPGAAQVRDLLVEAINLGLGSDSAVEAYAFDRETDNSLLILFRERGSGETQELETPERVWEILGALDEASYLGEVLRVEVTVAPDGARAGLLAAALGALAGAGAPA